MKKLTLSTLMAFAFATTSANAGVIVDLEAGAGVWDVAPSGTINYGREADLKQDLGLDSSTNTYFYADFNHFVPLVPNVRAEKQELKIDATKSIDNVTFGGKNYNENTTTKLDLSQTDVTLYWGVPGLKLLTAGMLRVDFGIDLKQFNGSITLNSTSVGTTTADLDFVVPMGYVGATFDPPFVPATISASYKKISYKDSSLDDMMAKVSVNLPIPLPLIDFKLDLGYKKQTLTIDDSLSDNLSADITFDGMIFGISAKF